MGFFSKLKEGLKKTKDNIGKKIFAAFSGRALDDDFYEELEEAMLTADMGVTATEQILDEFKDEVYREKITDTEKAKNLLKRIMVDSISYDIPDYDYPLVILLAGVNGVGKTTAIGKLANYFKSIGKSVVVAAADTFRAAASDQLEVWADRANVRIIKHKEGSDPASVVFDAISSAKARGDDVILVDTAGRLAVDEEMMNEIAAIKKAINPNEILFVVDSMTGQDAVNTAKEFNERLDFNGVVLTKLDGDTRGGAALSIRTVVNKPIKFVGTGEKLDAIDQFHPARMADRILGMGDIVSLVERAQEQYDEEEAKRLQKKIAKNQFDFNDFLSQIHQIKKMGNLKELASMIPGVGKAIKDIDIDDNAFKSIEAIIYSMTPQERTNPEILNGTRRTRIAKGSGTSIQEVNRLLKQFDQTRKMMKMVTGSKMGKMMPKLKK